MKIYGHSDTCPSEYLDLKEVFVIAEPQTLRELALFLVTAANVMESESGHDVDYFSFNDLPDEDEDRPEVTVMNTKVFKQ